MRRSLVTPKAARLAVLADPGSGHAGIAGVVAQVVDHVQQGVYRSRAWERGVVRAMFGNDWLERLAPDDRRRCSPAMATSSSTGRQMTEEAAAVATYPVTCADCSAVNSSPEQTCHGAGAGRIRRDHFVRTDRGCPDCGRWWRRAPGARDRYGVASSGRTSSTLEDGGDGA